ncbi:hypothetical protein Taro_015771 [Colocasia esculenta]|uniref:Pectinesterase n=1 Tax=Colocasia esculenta TaxID=4460 RepID=A0A843UIG4_COLES|nr:hypothetical protein [Colocasia esculenta]
MSSLWPVLLVSLITFIAQLQAQGGGAGRMISSSRLQLPPTTKGGLTKGTSAANHDLLLQNTNSLIGTADLVVAKDGSGDYRTITKALTASKKMRRGSTNRFVIYVKTGIYKETVNITKPMKNLMLVGDGMNNTIVTGSKSVDKVTSTFWTATFVVTGDGFIAQNMTFENTAGPHKGQAVALRSGSDLSVFYRCSFKGYQDTLYAHSGHQFYRECDIYGTIDFIFGDATAVFQNCNIFVRQPMVGQGTVVTAQGREDSASHTAGWLKWDVKTNFRTLYYGEYMNTGAGARTGGRVKWPGFYVITAASEAGNFTVEKFLNGSSWLPATGVPFTPGI